MDKNPLLGYLMNPDKKDVLHTSGYAKGSHGGNIGASSAESFHQRIEVDENRNYVGRYKDSKVMRESRNTLPKSVEYNQHEGQRNFAHSDAYGEDPRMNGAQRPIGGGGQGSGSGYGNGSGGGASGGYRGTGGYGNGSYSSNVNNGARRGFSRSEIPGLKERQAMMDRFNPGNLTGRSDGPAQIPARRNPGISR